MNTMAGFTCWESRDIFEVSAIDAVRVHPAAFLATHAPARLVKVNQKTFRRHGEPVGESAVFDWLIAPVPRSHDIVALTGDAGSGKSHLVRWLRQRTPSGDDRVLINVPKYGTGLRSICESILDVADSPALARAREMLRTTKAVETLDNAVVALRYELAQTIELRSQELPPNAADEVRWLHQVIPFALMDPVTSKAFQREGGAIRRLAQLSLSGRQLDDGLDDDAIRFGISDLPLDDLDNARASGEVRELLDNLRAVDNEGLRTRALEVLNDSLDAAKRRAFLHGDFSLTEVITEVRRALKVEGKDLYLFVEDLTVIHGLERELENALTIENSEHHCRMRAAIAITEGELAKWPTLAERCEIFAVEAAQADVDDTAFVGRYLNAIRLGIERLDQARETADDPGDRRWVPNACTSCEHRHECHDSQDGFGVSSDGYGLFPLRRETIDRMIRSTSHGSFNPRSVIRSVIQPVLRAGATELPARDFPSAALVSSFPYADGGTELRPSLRSEIVEKVQDADLIDPPRRVRALELWGEENLSTGNLPRIVGEAFSLPSIQVLEVLDGLASQAQTKRKPRTESTEPIVEYPELDEWAGGRGRLSSGVAGRIRSLALDAVLACCREQVGGWRVDTKEGRSLLVLESFQIDNAQGGRRGKPTIVLSITPDHRRALVFRALLQAADGKNWEPARLVQWRNIVQDWAETVLRRAEQEVGARVVRTTLESLVYLGRCTGADEGSDDPLRVLDGALRAPSSDLRRPGAFTDQFLRIAQSQSAEQARGTILQRHGAAKGAGGTLAVDARMLLPLVEETVDRWLFAPLESDSPAGDLRNRVGRELSLQRQTVEKALDEARKSLEGLGSSRIADVTGAVLGLADELERTQLATVNMELDQLRTCAAAAAEVSSADVRLLIANIEFDETDPSSRRSFLAHLAMDLPQRVEPLRRFCERAQRLLDRGETLVGSAGEQSEMADLGAVNRAADALVESVAALEAAL